MDRDSFFQQLLDDPGAAPTLLTNPLADVDAEWLITRLKSEADRNWYIDPNCSLLYADFIIQIGQARNDARQVGLGLMARGDAIKLLGRMQDAWETLESAGTVFQDAGDEIGWARTRIGRLWISVELERVTEALEDAERAREIFARHNRDDMLLRLEHNAATVYNLLGDHRQAIQRYESALTAAATLGESVQDHVAYIYSNLGYAYNFLGDFRRALEYYERARALMNQQTNGAALTELNIAYIAVAQGHYRRALGLLHHVETLSADQFPKEALMARRQMVECYLYLNRFVEARDLARQTVADYKEQGALYEAARTLLFLAQAEAELGEFDSAEAALDEAEPIYQAMGSSTWAATVALRRGQIALQHGDTATAREQSRVAQQAFDSNSRRVSYAEALLLEGQALYGEGQLEGAEQAVQSASSIARACSVPALRYSAHLLLGEIAEARGALRRAVRHYYAADATVQRVQRSLTITLRPGFLQTKGDALRALIRLHLQAGRVEQAFETLERAKSQALLSYLGNREQLRWADDDPQMRPLIDELNRLREEHHWFYHVAHLQDDKAASLEPQQALAEMAARERRMRTLTERLYLQTRSVAPHYAALPSLDDIRRGLEPGSLLIEYYNDGAQVWAFTLNDEGLQVHLLPISVSDLDALIDRFRRYIDRALRAAPEVVAQLQRATQQTAQQLYDALLEPLESRLSCCQQLVVVPYGALHYLPFHLLHTGRRYLIQDAEVVVLPSASLLHHHGAARPEGALVLAHSQNGHLPQTLAEGRVVRRLFGGRILAEDNAKRETLMNTAPRQILHIAAHGQHRIDEPDFSYIQLADGQLLSDDLMQHDLSYELVTLSGCETGLARVAPGDELIGLGRGFLYAGAGALVASLWRVDDQTATQLMEYFYAGLATGESKAAALRQAQCTLLALQPDLHPAFWGAFQLVGDPKPLSSLIDHPYEEREYDRFAIA